jgi:acetylornithine deacetylase
MKLDVVRLAQQLVRIPSLNPMNRPVSGPEYLEGRVTDFLQQLVSQDLGLPCERHPVLPGRDNLITRLEGLGDLAHQTLLLEVHQDTVPVDGMTIAPFAAQLEDGRIFGRGSCDVKGGMSAFLTTIGRLMDEPTSHRPTIVVAFTVNEENGFDGVKHLRDLWQSGKSRLLPAAPTAAIVAEPTELDVVVAHKGTIRWQCHARGRAAHSSNPSAGDNAIYRMGKALEALAKYAQNGFPPQLSHPLVGRPSLSVGTIQGGVSVNTVPDHCVIEIDRRLLPDESAAEARSHLENYLAEHLGDPLIEHAAPFLTSPALSSARNGSLAGSLEQTLRKHGLPGRSKGVPFGTDAGTISGAGVPVVVFGPGSIEQAHTKDEWIAVDSLEASVEVLVDFCRQPLPQA